MTQMVTQIDTTRPGANEAPHFCGLCEPQKKSSEDHCVRGSTGPSKMRAVQKSSSGSMHFEPRRSADSRLNTHSLP